MLLCTLHCKDLATLHFLNDYKTKKAILNMQNEDEKCFLWSVLAALHPVNRKDHPHRVQHYKCYEHQLNVSGIEFPKKSERYIVI